MLRIPSRALVVLIGPSSAGKSTWAAGAFRPEQVVASDDLRAVVGESRHDQRASAAAFDLLDRIVAARLSRRLLTVIDTTGLQADVRAGWVRAAGDADVPAIAVLVDTPAAVVRARNAERDRRLPAAALSRMLKAASVVTPDLLASEGFDEVHVVDGAAELLPAPDEDGPVAAVARPQALARTAQVVAADQVDAPADARRQRDQPVGLRFGLQIPRFDPAGPDLRAHLRDVARAVEEIGIASIWVMDHVMQIPQVGRAWEDMLEAYTTLGFLAGVTERVRLGALVTGITYRNLAMLGKQIATLDVLSGGRAVAGLGAAWFEREHIAYDVAFPDVPGRYALLRDALELLPLLWGPGTPSFEGRTTTVPEAICYPRPIQERIPILVGGSGERTTLRLVAEHADACNLFGDADTVRHKVEVLHRHCADVGRDPADVRVTTLGTVLAAPDRRTLDQRVADLTPAGRAPELTAERLGAGTVEDQVGRFRRYADVGVDEAIISLPVLDADRVRELAPLIEAFRN